jgi:hypothetical protein
MTASIPADLLDLFDGPALGHVSCIDRMAHKYLGRAYERRNPREIFFIEIDRVGHSGTWGS